MSTDVSKAAIEASSATYRKVVKKISEVLAIEPENSTRPSIDFEEVLSEIPEALKAKALDWYVRGIKRGFSKATDLMAEGVIREKNGNICAPSKMKFKVRTRVNGGDWESMEVEISAYEIGFTK